METNQVCHWPAQYAVAASLLLEAALLAESAERTRWDFAVELRELKEAGLSLSALRWLICQGMLAHATEVHGRPVSQNRLFQTAAYLSFEAGTCFVLTDSGRMATDHLGLEAQAKPKRRGDRPPISRASPRGKDKIIDVLRPQWQTDCRRLLLGKLVIKEFTVPAPNQELVLNVFQEEDWPLRIDDPLPPLPPLEPKRRLRETISALNRFQINALLRFKGDGRGSGVTWTLLQATDGNNWIR